MGSAAKEPWMVVPSASAWPTAQSTAFNKKEIVWTTAGNSTGHLTKDQSYSQPIQQPSAQPHQNLVSKFSNLSFVDNLSPDAWSPRSQTPSAPIVASSSSPSSPSSPVPSLKKKKKKDANDKANIEEELSKQNLYKTELCRSFMETGNCRYGPKCQFAHGTHEVRPVMRHPKYKTEICKKFANNGNCPYGNRCRFIHPGITAEEEIDPEWTKTWQSTTPTATTQKSEEKRSRLAVFQIISQVESQ